MHKSLVKENVSWRAPLSSWWVCAALVASALALAGVTLIDHALPEPLTRATATSDHFIAEIAYEHLLNLTSIGPRVAGSYENEVSAVRVLVSAMREIENAASPHNRLEVELHSASGAFPLAFLDGMNNVYRGVQMVVVRVSGMGERTGARRSALLLNCHFDTVPDSPGASDDGAGCAVLLETVRALAVRSQPLRRDLILLLNGAEENILQASHGFITTHRWAKSVRAFLNIEACGAGGREVLFQAGPHDPWIMEVYAGAVPHPFASSLAQELFQSGLIPADTDYRIFRDFGNLSGVDLAWSANGYVYHTHLDTAENVPLATLQRTGDNVLALTQGLLQSEDLDSEVDKSSRQPVFFDVLGLVVVSARAPLALLVAVATVAVVILDVHLSALEANRELYVRSGWWWRAVLVALGGWARAQAAGVLAAASVALALHVLGARLSFYAHPWLLAPLYAAPALAAAWWCAARERVASEWGLRGWRGALAWRQAGSLWAAGALAACAATGLRSGFLPLLWALGPALPGALLVMARAPRGGWLAVSWALGATLPALQTWYLALGSLRMFVPVLGRAGAGPVPADVMMAVLVSSLVLTACSWILPLVVAARNQQRLVRALVYACVAGCLVALASPPSASYSAERPQRLMVFHVRRSVHVAGVAGSASEEPFFWVPELDVNTGRTLRAVLGQEVRPVHTEECERWPYCGVPYYLPVLTLIPTSYVMSAPALPAATLHVRLHSARLDDTTQLLQLNITGPSHVVLIVSPVPGVKLSWSSAVETPRPTRRHGSARDTYFFTLHEARAPALWHVDLHLRHSLGAEGDMQGGARWADVSVAGHSLFGEQKTHEVHRQLLERLPAWVAPTGWAVHLQLYRV